MMNDDDYFVIINLTFRRNLIPSLNVNNKLGVIYCVGQVF